MKRVLMMAAVLTMINLTTPIVEAANEDDELSIMAAEQRIDNDADVTVRDDIETFDNNPPQASEENIPSEPEINNDIIKPNSANEENINIDGPNPAVNADNLSIDKPIDINNSIVTEDIAPNSGEVVTTVEQPDQSTSEINSVDELRDSVGMPSPIVTYHSFEEAARKVGYIPLYIPRKSGFAMNYIAVINDNIVEIRYGRRWEPTVTLSVRTYKRPAGEDLKDISGVYGVKWKIDLSSGTTIYIARVSDNSNVAAWAVGQYTFAAMTENLSFAAFHALVVEELVDLCNHYFVNLNE